MYPPDILSTARRIRGAAALLLTLGLAGCGGGFSVGVGSGYNPGYPPGYGYGGSPPSVQLAAAQSSASAGQSVLLVAAAVAQNGIDSVDFYRIDGPNWTLQGSVGAAPYQWQVEVPADGRTTLSVFARAFDRAGNSADSNVVTIAVLP